METTRGIIRLSLLFTCFFYDVSSVMYAHLKIALTHLNKGSPNSMSTASHWLHFYSFSDNPLDKLLLPA